MNKDFKTFNLNDNFKFKFQIAPPLALTVHVTITRQERSSSLHQNTEKFTVLINLSIF